MVRHKNRYIIVSINENDHAPDKPLKLNPISLHGAIQSRVQQLYGDFGVAAIRAGFTAKYCNENTKVAIIKVRHGPHKFVASALPLVNKLEEKPVVLNVIHVGATIKQCFEFLLDYQKRKFDEFVVKLRTVEEIENLRTAIMNIDDVLKIV